MGHAGGQFIGYILPSTKLGYYECRVYSTRAYSTAGWDLEMAGDQAGESKDGTNDMLDEQVYYCQSGGRPVCAPSDAGVAISA